MGCRGSLVGWWLHGLTIPQRAACWEAHRTAACTTVGSAQPWLLLLTYLASLPVFPRRCADFRDAAEKIAKVGFRMFLNVTAAVTNWNAEGTECSLVGSRKEGRAEGRLRGWMLGWVLGRRCVAGF